MKKLTSYFLVSVLFAGLFFGCKKDDKTSVPVLPPSGTMSIDFSNFSTSEKSEAFESYSNNKATASKTNWLRAAATAGVWNFILKANLVIPVASFEQARNNTPVYLDNSIWQWSYTFNVVGASYESRLIGQLRSNDVKWEMYISRSGIGAFSELLWYEGTSSLDGKSGQWVLNHSQQFPEPMLQIDWEAAEEGMGSIKYTFIREQKDDRSAEPFNGSYIEYGLTANTLNAYYNIHQNTGVAGVFNDLFIEWSTTNYNGHIKANSYFQDELWHCWDEMGDDVTCD